MPDWYCRRRRAAQFHSQRQVHTDHGTFGITDDELCRFNHGGSRQSFAFHSLVTITQTRHSNGTDTDNYEKLSYRWQTTRRLCTPMCAIKSWPLVNNCDSLTFTYSSPIWSCRWGGSPRAIGFIFGVGKLEWPGYNLVKVAWWLTESFGHNTSTWQTHRQPRRHSKCRANALRRAAKTERRNETCAKTSKYLI